MTASDPETTSIQGRLRQLWRAASIPLAAVLLAALIGAVILIISGANPLRSYAALLEGATERYTRVTQLALPALSWPASLAIVDGGSWIEARVPARERRAAPRQWRLRRIVGKSLFVLRLLRNGITFDGGLDYLAWKVERHSGVAVDPSWREGRFRLASLGAEVLRLYRRGAFR